MRTVQTVLSSDRDEIRTREGRGVASPFCMRLGAPLPPRSQTAFVCFCVHAAQRSHCALLPATRPLLLEPREGSVSCVQEGRAYHTDQSLWLGD